MTRRVVEKLCPEKVCVDFSAPKNDVSRNFCHLGWFGVTSRGVTVASWLLVFRGRSWSALVRKCPRRPFLEIVEFGAQYDYTHVFIIYHLGIEFPITQDICYTGLTGRNSFV